MPLDVDFTGSREREGLPRECYPDEHDVMWWWFRTKFESGQSALLSLTIPDVILSLPSPTFTSV